MWGTLPTNTYTEIEILYTTTTYSISGISGYTYRVSIWKCIHTDIHVYIYLHSKDIPVETETYICKKALISCSLT